ncbi:sensor histidine kinase [uncultured Tateyamaria sp.]|uniref:sensor histidine kinase n=1 Tax=uncultured Tateyamaria sp. TaxID=455651 RepID=UPI00260D70F5|nr:sensor histidine kinase [uncultured Tateyamaria sp.]
MTFPSLRSRLIVIILAPLFLIAAGVTVWQFSSETDRAEDIFDRGLLSAALAISRDVAISDGDALSPTTRRLINNTSGGEVFYHVFAPDGVFVTGYSTPPVLPKSVPAELSEPYYYDARYQGRDVRVMRFQYVTTVSDVAGVYNVTVWQNAALRRNFVQELVTRSTMVIASLVVSVGFIVWFGVGLGLRPLLDLEQAIAKRTPTELEPIRRDVPAEARGIVTTLNALLDRVSRRISSKDEFISNAAHQLRNPVAGVLALAEAVENAPNPEAAKTRSAELILAARQASRLTNQLLSFERAAGSDLSLNSELFDLNTVVTEVADSFGADLAGTDVTLDVEVPDRALRLRGDRIMIKEAIRNILNNALVHGGARLTRIALTLSDCDDTAVVTIRDNGVGIPKTKHLQAINRFGQVNAGPGSGLGLPIAVRVMSQHKGHLDILDVPDGAGIQLTFPIGRP